MTIRFDDELNDFLSTGRRGHDFTYSFKGSPSLKHLVEALRVPHTEVGRIIINGRQESLSYLVQDGDQIKIFCASPQTSERNRIQQVGSGIEQPKFLLDNHLGKLAVYLRLLGFDVSYRNDYQDEVLVAESLKEERILLTRDRGLLMRRVIQRGYCIRTLDPKRQVVEVLQRFDLFDKIVPFQRCLRCNSLLQYIEKEAIIQRLEPLTRLYYNEFRICPHCDRIYWKGSHYQRMEDFLKQIKEHG
jgi:uncharacterized protein with PIN domain